jgi:SnoaL-like domain
MQYGLSPEEIEWVREGYRQFREGDPSFMDRYTQDATFRIPSTLPAGGTYNSPLEALEFWTTIAELAESPYPDPEDFVRAGDRLIVFGTWRGRPRHTGEEIAVRFIHSFRTGGAGGSLVSQKLIDFELFIDTAAMLQAFGLFRPDSK